MGTGLYMYVLEYLIHINDTAEPKKSKLSLVIHADCYNISSI